MQEYLCAPPPRVPRKLPLLHNTLAAGPVFLPVKGARWGSSPSMSTLCTTPSTSSPSVGELERILSHPQQLARWEKLIAGK